MNKAEIINNIAEEHGITKVAAKAIFEQVFADVTAAMMSKKAGNKITIPGFGTFKMEKRPARTGRNPRTGESMKIPAKQVVKFKASTTLSEKIN